MQHRLSIRTRLAIVVGIGVLGLLSLGTYEALSQREATRQARVQEIATLAEAAAAVLRHFDEAVRVDAGLSLEDAQTLARDIRFGADDYLFVYDYDGLNRVLGPDPEREGTPMLNVTDPNGVPLVRELISAARAGGGAVAYDWPRAGSDVPVPKIGYAVAFEPWGWIVGTGVYVDDLQEAFLHKIQWTGLIVLAITIASAAIAILVSLSIGKDIGAMATIMRRLADGRLDIIIPKTGRRDEIGAMEDALHVFHENAAERDRLQADKLDHQQATDERRRAIQAMADRVDVETADVVQAVASRVGVLDDAARSLIQAVTSVGGDADTASAAATLATGNAQTVASAAEELSTSIAEIGRQVSHSAAVAEHAVELVGETRSVVSGLADAAASIGKIVDVINQIAAQTNLLALNATIEAARAGEAGRGFAVVAGEVKSLAKQTAMSTEEITGQVAAIQNVSQSTTQSFERVTETILEISEIAQSITTAVDGQMAATTDIATNIQESAVASADVTERMARVLDAADRSGKQAQAVKSTTDDLTTNVQDLRQSLTRIVRTATPDSDRRVHERHACTVAAVVRTADGRPIDTRIADISCGGLRLASVDGLVIGDSVTMAIPALNWSRPAKVCRLSPDGAHLAFCEGTIPESELTKLLGTSAPRAA